MGDISERSRRIVSRLERNAVDGSFELRVDQRGPLLRHVLSTPSRLLDVITTKARWVGVAIDCADAGPVAHFYQRLLGFEMGDFAPPHWAQLWDPAGGVHLNIQGEDWYEPPTWPERGGQQAKMLHFEVEVDDLEAAIATAIEGGGTEAPWQPPDRNRERDGPTRLRVGMRAVSLGTTGRPSRAVERPAALRPAVAAAMIRLVERPGAVLDPCCGTGTIAVEAAAAGRRAVAADLDAGAVAAAVANGVASATRLDARRLPFATNSVVAVVTNLPFGRQHLVQGAPVAWYRRALTEALRVASQAVVLAAPTQPFRQALGRVNANLTHRYPLELLGNRTTIWVLHRPDGELLGTD